jgi:enoyl-[acyl-carrier protein] reductase / trans-2-enoyl-CoA reductase (NAD+)
MIIKPRVKDFICLTSHPEGCKENVRRQIEYVKSQPKVELGKRVLVLGASTGYGLASRICATYASGASTIWQLAFRCSTRRYGNFLFRKKNL